MSGSNAPITGSNNFLALVGNSNATSDPNVTSKRLGYVRYDQQQVPSQLFVNDDYVLLYSAENAQTSVIQPAYEGWSIGSDTDTIMYRLDALNASINYLPLGSSSSSLFNLQFSNTFSPTLTFPTTLTRYLWEIDFAMMFNPGAPEQPDTSPNARPILLLAAVDNVNEDPISGNALSMPSTNAMRDINRRTWTPCSYTTNVIGGNGGGANQLGVDTAVHIHAKFEMFPQWPNSNAVVGDRLNGIVRFAPWLVFANGFGKDLTNTTARMSIRIWRIRW